MARDMNYQYSFAVVVTLVSVLAIVHQFPFSSAVIISLAGMAGYILTDGIVPKISALMLKIEIFGFDIHKVGTKQGEAKIPECVGFAGAVAFIIISCLASFYFQQQDHLAVLATIIATVLLGFADDMLDLAWRYKLIFPIFIILPIVSVYSGSTSIHIIYPFTLILGRSLNLHSLFLIYNALLCIYCTNTINIYAGINGLEVGQSIVAAASLLIYFSVTDGSYEYSTYLLVLFLGTAVALMKYNGYPSKVFIGDTFCYFAGITLALAALYGNCSVVIHFFLIPQLINFLYSCPQLLGYYNCERHRLAEYLPKEDRLRGRDMHMNMLNLSLRVLGPTNEGVLCMKLLLFQLAVSLLPILYELF